MADPIVVAVFQCQNDLLHEVPRLSFRERLFLTRYVVIQVPASRVLQGNCKVRLCQEHLGPKPDTCACMRNQARSAPAQVVIQSEFNATHGAPGFQHRADAERSDTPP
jgi:hypothetical protein